MERAVSQDSMLASLFFVIYINTFSKKIPDYAKFIMSADDTTLALQDPDLKENLEIWTAKPMSILEVVNLKVNQRNPQS